MGDILYCWSDNIDSCVCRRFWEIYKMNYRTFTRTWWRNNPKYPNVLEPYAGRKTYYGRYKTAREARVACFDWNKSHPPGRLGRKMEYEEK